MANTRTRAQLAKNKKMRQAVAYMRTSSKANMNGDSQGRQLQAIQERANQHGVPHNGITKVGECISGMAPMAMRKRLQDLIKHADVKKIFVESASRVARSAKVAEEIYETAKASRTEIIVANNPSLFKLDATPEENFFRRIAFATAEYERDVLVERLQSGLRAAAAKQGGVPVQGRKTILNKIQPTKKQKKILKALIAKRGRGDFGYRPLAEKFSEVLKLKSPMSYETCRRLCTSLGY